MERPAEYVESSLGHFGILAHEELQAFHAAPPSIVLSD